MEHSVSKSVLPRHLADLRAFCIVLDVGSISLAAQQLKETKGSISRRLTRIELDLGITLLTRTTRMLKATEHGAAYYKQARRALNILADASAILEKDKSPAGQIRISVSHGFGVTVLAPLIFDFMAEFPEIKVEVALSDDPPQFNSGQVDAAIYPARGLRDSSLIAKKLLDWQITAVAAPAYLRDREAPTSPQALKNHRLLFGSGRPHLVVKSIRVAAQNGGRPQDIVLPDAAVSTNTLFAREIALTGGGIAFVPDFMVEQEIADGRLVEILPKRLFNPRKGAIYLLYPAAKFVSPKVRAFRSFITKALAARAKY